MKELYNKKTETNDKIFNFFYLMTVGVLIAWVMVSGIVDTTIFQRTHLLNLMRVFVVVLAFGLILTYETVTKIAFWAFAAATLFIVTGFMLFALRPESTGMMFNTAELLLRSVQYMVGMRAHTPQYENIIVWSLILFFSFVTVYFGYARFRFWILLTLLNVTTSIAITSPYFREQRIFYVAIFCLLILVIVKLQQENQMKIGNLIKARPLSKQIIPITAAVVILATVIPTPPTGGADGFFRRVVQAPFNLINNIFSDLTTQAEFSLANVGFGGHGGRLGGNVTVNDRVFMRIRTSRAMPLYLTGATSDTYTGYSWLSLHAEYDVVDRSYFGWHLEAMENYIRLEFSQLVENMALINSGRPLDGPYRWNWFVGREEEFDFGDRYFIDTLTGMNIQAMNDPYSWQMGGTTDFSELQGLDRLIIDTLNTRMSSLFHSGVVHNVTVPDEVEVVRNRDGRIVTSSRMERGATYEIALTNVSSGTRRAGNNPRQASYHGVLTDIATMLETFPMTHGYYLRAPLIWFNTELIFDDYSPLPTVYNATTTVNLLNNYLIPRAERIRDIYTQLPDGLPERVRDLAEFVTAEATNDYDRMLLLEAFLRSNFDYTLSPGPSPVGRDFVDHFLFDIQRGYCVHFATAFVVMARALGMPTRYVEGFLIQGQSRFDDIYVLNNMAHAWPEVYFEGYGWVRFEPTPAYGGFDDGGFTGGGLGGVGGGGGFWDDYQNLPYWLNPGGQHEPGYQPGGTISGQGGNQDTTGNANATTGSAGIAISPLVILIPSIAAVPIGFLARLGYVKYQKNRFDKTDNHELMNREYQRLLGYLQLFNQTMLPTETEIAFMARIKGQLNLPIHEQEFLVQAAEIYAKGRYSHLAITDTELTVFEKIIARLDGRVLDEIGKVRYYWYRHFIGKI